MFTLDEKTIKKQTTAVIFDRGKRLYSDNYVKDIKVELDKNSTLKVLEGLVTSLEERRELQVEVLLGMRTETIEYDCECSDFKAGKKKKACKHIVAVLLRHLKGQPAVYQMQFDMESAFSGKKEKDKEAEVLEGKKIESNTPPEEDVAKIEEVAVKTEEATVRTEEADVKTEEVVTTEEKPEKKLVPKAPPRIGLNLGIQFECFCSTKLDKAFIKLKLGENSLSEIKNVKEFLLALKHKKVLEISDSFSFLPQIHSFKKEDISLIKLVAASNFFGPDKFDNDKVWLEAKEVKSFFDLMGSRRFDFTINGQIYKNKNITYKDLPLELMVKEEAGRVVLKQNNEMPTALTAAKEYYFFRNQIFKPHATQAYRYSSLYEEFVSSGRAEKVYESDDTEATIALLAFKFKEISKEFKINSIQRPKAQPTALTTKINISLSDRGIIARPVFCYEAVEIDPFSHTKYKNSEKVGRRDLESERKVIDLIKRYHFSHTAKGFLLDFENSSEVVSFIKTCRDKLESVAQLSFSDEFRQVRIYEAKEYTPEIHFYTNYLEFSLKINDINLRDINQILEAVDEGEDYYRLSNGDYISLANSELQKIADIVGGRTVEDKSAVRGNFTVSRRVSIFSGRGLSRANQDRLPVRKFSEEEELRRKQRENERVYEEKNKKLKEILTNMEQAKEEEHHVPPELASIMRNYQKTGYKWFKVLANQKLGGILADDMGLGKTLQAIALILSYIEECKEARKPTLVVAPTSIIYNWENEIRKFAPELKAIVVYGGQRERRSLMENLEGVDIIVTTYSLMAKDVDEYKNMEFKFCFIDEAQQIKNARTQAARAVKTVKAEARFALTGTPIENSLSELWSIFDFVMPGYLLSHRRFKEHYELAIMKHNDTKALENLNNIIRPFILRRLKREVLYELPPKTEQQVIIEMTEEQKEAYMEFLSDAKQSIDNQIGTSGFNRSQIHILSALTKLRQLCCHPSIVMEDYIGESGKMLALDSIIEESILNNHRILIFSQFVSVLQMLKSRLTENGVEWLYLDGSTKSQERMRLVEEFNSGKGEVFLISLKAGGFGLNLTGADIVVHFDPWWNPAVEEQATDRAHRIGQTKNVEVIKLITKGSIEEKILKLHERKKTIANSVISGKDSEAGFITEMTREEIEELFT